MNDPIAEFGERSRLRLLLDRLLLIEDPREPHRVANPRSEILLLSVCGTIADCDDYDDISDWGEQHLDFLRRFSPFHFGVPCGRWLTIMMNRVNPVLFSACFSDWVRACWPDRPELVAIDGKTLRRSHDRSIDQPALHLVSAFATTSGLVLGQEVVSERCNELSAIPVLLERLGAEGGLNGALVGIDAIACNGTIAQRIREQEADYLLAVKLNQPTLRREVEALFKEASETRVERFGDVDKGHGRIEQRDLALIRDVSGSTPVAGSLVNCDCLTSPPSSNLRRVPSSKNDPASRRATTSPRPARPLRSWPAPFAATGGSKTSSTGPSM